MKTREEEPAYEVCKYYLVFISLNITKYLGNFNIVICFLKNLQENLFDLIKM